MADGNDLNARCAAIPHAASRAACEAVLEECDRMAGEKAVDCRDSLSSCVGQVEEGKTPEQDSFELVCRDRTFAFPSFEGCAWYAWLCGPRTSSGQSTSKEQPASEPAATPPESKETTDATANTGNDARSDSDSDPCLAAGPTSSAAWNTCHSLISVCELSESGPYSMPDGPQETQTGCFEAAVRNGRKVGEKPAEKKTPPPKQEAQSAPKEAAPVACVADDKSCFRVPLYGHFHPNRFGSQTGRQEKVSLLARYDSRRYRIRFEIHYTIESLGNNRYRMTYLTPGNDWMREVEFDVDGSGRMLQPLVFAVELESPGEFRRIKSIVIVEEKER